MKSEQKHKILSTDVGIQDEEKVVNDLTKGVVNKAVHVYKDEMKFVDKIVKGYHWLKAILNSAVFYIRT